MGRSGYGKLSILWGRPIRATRRAGDMTSTSFNTLPTCFTIRSRDENDRFDEISSN